MKFYQNQISDFVVIASQTDRHRQSYFRIYNISMDRVVNETRQCIIKSNIYIKKLLTITTRMSSTQNDRKFIIPLIHKYKYLLHNTINIITRYKVRI